MTAPRKPSAAPVERFAIRWHDSTDPRPWLHVCDEHGAAWRADPAEAMPFATRTEARAMANRWAHGLVKVVVHPAGREAARRAR